MQWKIYGLIGGVVVLGGVGFWATRSPQPVRPARTAIGTKKTAPTDKKTGKHSKTRAKPRHKATPQPLSLAASFQARSHLPLPSGVAPVTVPWQPQTSWVFVPHAIQGRLWFGSRQGNGSWHWVSEDLPGMLSKRFPSPVYDSLQWADDLHSNEPGPSLPGAIQWNTIMGRVGEPVGWTTQTLSAADSPIGGKTLELTVWVPSETGVFHGVYGLETMWNAQNAQTGHEALLMLEASPTVP